jgi:hypothetical protein
MSTSDSFKGFLFWFIIIAASWWYFGIYQTSHPPKPSAVETAKEDKYKSEKAYKEAHPEEDENLALLSAKYGVGIKSVQAVIQAYESPDIFEQRNKQELILNIATKAGISEKVVAAILIDYSYLTSDCSQPEPVDEN